MLKKILPDGYYKKDEANPYIIRLYMGPYKGLKIQICENIKIREDVLTGMPNLCYNYRILDYSSFDILEVDSSKSLSRILAAIVVEMLSEEMYNGGTLESVQCPKTESKT